MVQQLHLKLLESNTDNGPLFSGEDSFDKFTKNLDKQPAEWPWRNKPVTYSLNTQRYRAPNWDRCDWDNSILLFGCSMVYGVGVDDTETLGYQLSQQLSIPVINLGQPATGLGFVWANSIILRERGIRPKAVVYVWSDRSRQTEFVNDNTTISHGAWNATESWMMPLAIHNKHNYHWAKYTIRNLRLLWNCPVIEASWWEDMSSLASSIQLPFEDYARDMSHPGPKTLKLSATILSTELNTLLN